MSTQDGPPRPGSWLSPSAADVRVPDPRPDPRPDAVPDSVADAVPDDLAASLAGLPVAAHVDVLTAEHDRLHRLLATIDQL